MSNSEGPKTPFLKQEVIQPSSSIEGVDLIPVRVNDYRSPEDRSFDLDKFVEVIGKLKGADLYDLRDEFTESDYGKYMLFATAESDRWNEAVQNAQAVEITVTNLPNSGFSHREGMTRVDVKVLMTEKSGRVFDFQFKPDGKYSSGGSRDVYLEKVITNSEADGNNFILETEKELE